MPEHRASWLERLRRLWRGREAEMAEEIRLHLEHRAAQHRAAGLPDEEARSAAMRQLGNIPLFEQIAREGRPRWRLESVARDLAQGVRMLRRAPGAAATVIVTLALGLGVNVAVFSIVRAVLIEDLPYADASRVVTITQRLERAMPQSLLADDVAAIERDASLVEIVSGSNLAEATIRGDLDPIRAGTARVLPRYFDVFGVAPAMGRPIAPADFAEDARVAVLSTGAWRQAFAARPDVLGQVLHIDREPFTVVGVMPASFEADPRVWTPFVAAPRNRNASIETVARVRRDTTIEAAAAQIDAIVRARQPEGLQFPDQFRRFQGAGVTRLGAEQVDAARPGLVSLQAIAGVLLLLTCANLANVFLAHGGARTRELGVRAAIGANRGRLVRQLVTEALVLSVAGGLAGVGLAAFALPALIRLGGRVLPRGDAVAIGVPELALGFVVAMLTSLVFAGLPAWSASRVDPVEAMRTGAPASTRARAGLLRTGLVAVQVAVALVVLLGAGLLVRSAARVAAIPLGFDARGFVTGQVRLPAPVTDWRRESAGYRDRLESELTQRAGAGTVLLVSEMPYDRNTLSRVWTLYRDAVELHVSMAGSRHVTPGYFEGLHIRTIAGRTFGAGDTESAPDVAVVSEAFVRQFAPGDNPIGLTLRAQGLPGPITIVGIVADTRNVRPTIAPRPAVYLPLAQTTPTSSLTIAIDGLGVAEASAVMRAAARAVDANVPVTNIGSVSGKIAASEEQRTFYLAMLAVFATLAVTLAVVGVYGVVSHVTGQRRREMGVRLALGASPVSLVSRVVAQGLGPVAAGLAAGLVAAWWIGRLLATHPTSTTLLRDVSVHDPITMAGASLLFLTAAALACWIPARRASATSLTEVLRVD